MKESITVLPFTFDPDTEEMEIYFEIHGSDENQSIYLCKVVNADVVTTINKIAISTNPKYAEWLMFVAANSSKGCSNTPLKCLYNSSCWFVSSEHRDADKYIWELTYCLEAIKGE